MNLNIGKSEEIEKEMYKLRDIKIWMTRKARIAAEERLNKYHFWSQMLITYYSLVVLALSVISLVIDSRYKGVLSFLSVSGIIASAALLCISLLVNSYSFKERAIAFKSCYIKLESLSNAITNAILEYSDVRERMNVLKKVEQEYTNLLDNTENHKDIDYAIAEMQATGISEERKEKARCKYYAYQFLKALVIGILIALPILVWFCWMNFGGSMSGT